MFFEDAHRIHVWQLVNKRMLASMFDSVSKCPGEEIIPFATVGDMCFWAIAHDQLQDESFLSELLSFKLLGITQESYIFMTQSNQGKIKGWLPIPPPGSTPAKKKENNPPPPPPPQQQSKHYMSIGLLRKSAV